MTVSFLRIIHIFAFVTRCQPILHKIPQHLRCKGVVIPVNTNDTILEQSRNTDKFKGCLQTAFLFLFHCRLFDVCYAAAAVKFRLKVYGKKSVTSKK